MQKLRDTLLTLLLTALSAQLAADPIAFSVNSDGVAPDEDILYRIDLGAGTHEVVGQIDLPWSESEASDVEGMALDANGTLYAFDDMTTTLFRLDKQTVVPSDEQVLSDLPTIGGTNDVGMTFACDGTLYMTSVATNLLYRVSLSGDMDEVGPLGADINISGIAAYGNPTRLYGLGNGNTASPRLYEIHTGTGAATPVGTLGALAEPYNEGGLDFDASGRLWAITDRRIPNELGSQVLEIDVDRVADLVVAARTLPGIGFESLAVAPPAGCEQPGEIPGDPPGEEPVQDPPEFRTAGVPALSPSGLIIASLLLLLTGLLASRRF
jgi:sugar lactone lactonase YvrE